MDKKITLTPQLDIVLGLTVRLGYIAFIAGLCISAFYFIGGLTHAGITAGAISVAGALLVLGVYAFNHFLLDE